LPPARSRIGRISRAPRDPDNRVAILAAPPISPTQIRRVARGNILAVLPSVMRTAVVPMVVAASLAGCFYVDPINERPGADIRRIQPELPNRGDTVEVHAKIIDPDGDATVPDWRAFACDLDGCDALAFDTSADEVAFVFTAPFTRDSGAPATYVHVELAVVDALGAPALPPQSVDINVGNAPPSVMAPQRSGRFFRGAFPVDTTVTLTFAATDGDDGLAGLTFEPVQLFPPSGATLEDAVFARVDDALAADGEAIYELTASAPGQWEVALTVSDPLGVSASSGNVGVPFAADHPPCLHVADPEFPPADARIVLDERRRFAVLAIDDDRDVFPPPPLDDDVLGAASFRWWLATPASGGALEPLAVDGNGVTLDPAGWSPGDLLELRVEAVDREDRPLCDSTMASCELVAGCFQRQTWAMEVR
jgi:hypothetical protein